MSTDERMPDDHSCGDDVAAYALGALDRAEAARFERHLETCTICREELAAVRQVVDVLPMAAPQLAAPARLRRDVMRAIADEPRGARTRGPAARPRAWIGWPRGSWPALGLAGALAVAAVAVAIVLGTSGSSSTRTIAAQVTGTGTAALRVSGGRAQLVLRHFPAAPAGDIYEVWLQRGSAAPSPTTALFGVTARGDADVAVPGSLRGVTQVMVTPEPAGGSPHPTHAPVIQARL